MQLHIADDAREFARLAADVICTVVTRRPEAVLGLPSGKTPLAVYDELAARVTDGRADLSGVTAFAIDELHGLPPEHPATNASYFRRHLLQRVPLRAFYVMHSATSDPDAECRRFAERIDAAGGLDLIVLGIGVNGHIAFNEPSSPFDSRARCVALEPSTRAAFSPVCGSLAAVPSHGLTLGIADLLDARESLLLASGPEKAQIAAQALTRPPTPKVPASALQYHPKLTVVLDRDAASSLS